MSMNVIYLARFRQGHGSMLQNAIDFFKDNEGNIICHEWAMGGETKTKVSTVPKSIDGFIAIETRNE